MKKKGSIAICRRRRARNITYLFLALAGAVITVTHGWAWASPTMGVAVVTSGYEVVRCTRLLHHPLVYLIALREEFGS